MIMHNHLSLLHYNENIRAELNELKISVVRVFFVKRKLVRNKEISRLSFRMLPFNSNRDWSYKTSGSDRFGLG